MIKDSHGNERGFDQSFAMAGEIPGFALYRQKGQ